MKQTRKNNRKAVPDQLFIVSSADVGKTAIVGRLCTCPKCGNRHRLANQTGIAEPDEELDSSSLNSK